MQRRTFRLAFWCVVGLTVMVRGGVSVAMLSSLCADPDAYRAIAETIREAGIYGLSDASGGTRPTAFRPPLYPWVLAMTSPHRVVVAVLHVVLGAITVGLTVASTQLLFRRTAASVVAGLLVAIDPILVQQSSLVMTETLAVAIVAGVFYRWSIAVRDGLGWSQCVWVGGLLSLAYLCRPTFLVWAALLVLALGADALIRRSRWWPPIIVGGMVALTLGAWMIRNVGAVGHPVWATTHGGYTLLLANNPSLYDHLRQGQPIADWDPQAFFDAYSHRYAGDPTTRSFWETDWSMAGPPTYPDDAGEVNDDRYVNAAAKATIVREPQTFAWACCCRWKVLWTPVPAAIATGSASLSGAIGVYYFLIYLAAIVGAWRWNDRCWLADRQSSDRQSSDRQSLADNSRLRSAVWLSWIPIAAMVVTLSIVHAVYWSNMRMRAPAMPLIAIVAAAGFVSIPRRDSMDVANG
jgi:hypothetical protein